MKYIDKGESPDFFEEWKKAGNETWDDIEEKDHYYIKAELRRHLLKEQGYICCYCGQGIDEGGKSVIEHIKCRDNNKELHLDYKNLLASCLGGQKGREGKNKKQRRKIPIYCDANKGNDDIEILPLDPDCESKFIYGVGGELEAASDDMDTINTIKTLNIGTSNTYLKNQRKGIIGKWIQDGLPTPEEIGKLLEYFSCLTEHKDANGNTILKYKPYSQAVIGALKAFI